MKRKISIGRVIGLFTLSALILGALFTLIQLVFNLSSLTSAKLVLRIGKLLLGAILVGLPLFLSFKWMKIFNDITWATYYIFIFFAILCGELFSFYTLFQPFDSFLHVLSGALISAIGFQLAQHVLGPSVHPWFLALFAFCFAMALGCVWEAYEFIGDRLLDLNMQRYQGLIGWNALWDTMKDIFCNAAGSLSMAIFLGLRTFYKPSLPFKK